MDEENDPDEYDFAFEFIEPDLTSSDTVTLICHPSRRLTMDEYIDALKTFIERLDISTVMAEDSTRNLH